MNILNQMGKSMKKLTDNANNFINEIVNNQESEQESEQDLEELRKPNILINNPLEHNLSEHEQNLEDKFIGCYVDDPTNPILTDFLGEVDDQHKCILKGKESNYKFIGVQQGNKCFGTNVLPEDSKKVQRIKCNTKCNDKSKGNCGGFYYNQIYSTDSDSRGLINDYEMSKPNEIFEKYKNINLELFQINNNLKQDNFVDSTPINPYALILWLVIIIIIIYLVVEYINKHSKTIV